MSLLFSSEPARVPAVAPLAASVVREAASRLPEWLASEATRLADETSMQYLARHSHSFRYASRFLPPPFDRRVADVYAFCRFTDDLVDGVRDVAPDILRERLETWRALARDSYHGQESGFPLLDRPLVDMAREGIPFAYASDLIDGVAMDLSPRRYASLEELDLYSHRVASVVGLWLTELVGVRDPAVLERAADLGHAMQLTNILRDVGEDWERGRLYLPLDVLARHGIREEDIAAARATGEFPVRWSAAMEELMAVADARYARALEAIGALPRFFRRPVTIAALVYRDIHTVVRRNGYDNLRRRAHTGVLRKVWLGFKARLLPVRRSDMKRANGGTRVPAASASVLAASLLAAAPAAASGYGDAGTAARRQLAAVESVLAANPAAVGPYLERLRLLHVLSVQDDELLPVARRALREAERRLGKDGGEKSGDFRALFLAYRGALDVVEARHGFWPRERLEPLKRGLPLLDTAVRREPDNAEIRYLRLTSSYYLPFFLGRKWSVREDFDALAGLLPEVRKEVPPDWFIAVADFVLENGELSSRERERLIRSRNDAASSTSSTSSASSSSSGARPRFP